MGAHQQAGYRDMSLSAGEQSIASSLIKRLVALSLGCLVLFCLAGCLTSREVSYQNQVSKMRDRFDETAKKWEATMKEFAGQMQAVASATSFQDFSAKWSRLLDLYVPILRQYLTEFEQIQSDIVKLKPPKKYETAHSIYTSAMSSIVTSTAQFVNGLDMARQLKYEDQEGASATINNASAFIVQGVANLKKADEMVFSTNWGLIVGVILAVFAIVAGIIGLLVYLVRRKGRDQAGYLSSEPAPTAGYPVPGYPAAGYPPPSGVYPPPLPDYRPPPEAYPSQPQDIYAVPPTPDYPASTLPPAAPPHDWHGSSTQMENCPRCGAHIPATSSNCPSCGASLLDERG